MINPPQAGAIAFGLIRSVAALAGGEPATGRPMTVVLASDHRILYGDRAARFLGAVKSLLEDAAI